MARQKDKEERKKTVLGKKIQQIEDMKIMQRVEYRCIGT